MKTTLMTRALINGAMYKLAEKVRLTDLNEIRGVSRGQRRSIAGLPLCVISGLIAAVWLTQLGGCYLNRKPVTKEATPDVHVALPDYAGASNLDDIASLQQGPGRRHIIIVIGDGMQLANEIATSRYLYDTDFGLSIHTLPVKSYMTTWDVTVYDIRAAKFGVSTRLRNRVSGTRNHRQYRRISYHLGRRATVVEPISKIGTEYFGARRCGMRFRRTEEI